MLIEEPEFWREFEKQRRLKREARFQAETSLIPRFCLAADTVIIRV